MKSSPEKSTSREKLTRLALLLAIALVAARCMMLETVRDTDRVLPGDIAIPHSPGPAAGLAMDLLLCVPALLAMLRSAIDSDFRLRFGVSHLLFGALAILAAASACWSSDKFAAAVTAAHLVAAAALMWAMTQLVRSWLDLRLVAAACFGVLLVYVVNGAIYRTVDLPDSIKYWEQNKQQELARRGWEPDSFHAVQFEKKLRAGEMLGFNTSPNSFAAMLVMLGIVSAGAAIQRIKNRDEYGWPAAIVAGVVAAAWIGMYTNSRTALLTPLLAAAILGAVPWLPKKRRTLYIACAIAVVLVTSLLVLRGITTGTLFGDSLTFRWRYWVGAARVFEQHPLFGVGWSNFASHYLGVRLPIASEEIRDPHNLVVRAFVELGVIGGAIMLAWLARLAWELTTPRVSLAPTTASGRATAATIASICVGAIAVNVLASIDFTPGTTERQWYVMLELLKRLLFAGLLILGVAVVMLRSSTEPRLDDRPAPWVLWAIITAAGIFLLHNLVDFSLFEPGAMGLFALLAGAALAARSADGINARPVVIKSWCVTLLMWLLAGALGVVLPVWLAEDLARRADKHLRANEPLTAAAGYHQAFDLLWIPNADYVYRAAMAKSYTQAPADEIRALLDAAIAADPMDVQYYRTRAALELRQPQPDARRIVADMEKAIALNPSDVSTHVELAEAFVRFGDRERAIEQYRAALHYNDLLDPNEPKRMTPAQIADIEQHIQSLTQ